MKSSGNWRVLLLVASVTSEDFFASDRRSFRIIVIYRLLIIVSCEKEISKMQGVM